MSKTDSQGACLLVVGQTRHKECGEDKVDLRAKYRWTRLSTYDLWLFGGYKDRVQWLQQKAYSWQG